VVFNPWFHVFWISEFHGPVIWFFINRVFVHFWPRFPPNGPLFCPTFRPISPIIHPAYSVHFMRLPLLIYPVVHKRATTATFDDCHASTGSQVPPGYENQHSIRVVGTPSLYIYSVLYVIHAVMRYKIMIPEGPRRQYSPRQT
jgi:hypothetical protein